MCFADPVADCLAEMMVLVLSDSFVILSVLCHTGFLVAGFPAADFLAIDFLAAGSFAVGFHTDSSAVLVFDSVLDFDSMAFGSLSLSFCCISLTLFLNPSAFGTFVLVSQSQSLFFLLFWLHLLSQPGVERLHLFLSIILLS